jgi:hypothetical protein
LADVAGEVAVAVVGLLAVGDGAHVAAHGVGHRLGPVGRPLDDPLLPVAAGPRVELVAPLPRVGVQPPDVEAVERAVDGRVDLGVGDRPLLGARRALPQPEQLLAAGAHARRDQRGAVAAARPVEAEDGQRAALDVLVGACVVAPRVGVEGLGVAELTGRLSQTRSR